MVVREKREEQDGMNGAEESRGVEIERSGELLGSEIEKSASHLQ